jgi:hypothetical protein
VAWSVRYASPLLAALCILLAEPAEAQATRVVYLDKQGVIRWSDDRTEVALFGANYVLPTASDYRAAGYLHADRKKMIDEGMAHFRRVAHDVALNGGQGRRVTVLLKSWGAIVKSRTAPGARSTSPDRNGRPPPLGCASSCTDPLPTKVCGMLK